LKCTGFLEKEIKKAKIYLKIFLKRLDEPFVLKDDGSSEYSDNCSMYWASLLYLPLDWLYKRYRMF